jgi:hypothetical protein
LDAPKGCLCLGDKKQMRLTTICESILWAGFFGINEHGDQPECLHETAVEVEDEDEYTEDKDGLRPVAEYSCPSCGGSLGWPQKWVIMEE